MSETKTPEVGMGATLCYPSDRYPYTIIGVSKSGKTITLQADNPGKNRAQWPEQDYDPQPDPNGALLTARLGRYGWKANGVGVLVGIRRFYQAPEL
jgi:hypothetical protein